MGLNARRLITNFDGNFDELTALMRDSWSGNKEQALEYDREFLRSAFEYPGCSFDLAPAIYRQGRLVAFVAGSPRRVRFAKRPLLLLNVSFLTVAPEYKRSGYGPLVWRELMDRGRSLGFDGTINFCVEGDDMNRQMLSLAALCRQPTRKVFSIGFWARLLPSEGGVASMAECTTTAETEIFMEAAKRVAEDVTFSRLWTEEEAEWQCHRRYGALTCAVDGTGRGILAGYSIKTLGAATTSIMLDDILWGDLAPSDRITLARGFLARATERGAQMVILPLLGFADTAPFVAVGFRKIRRVLHVFLTLWNEALPETSITSMYIDVL